MFTIDLLKGQGIPERSRPGNILLLSLTLIVPMVIGMMMAGFYISNRVAISIQRQDIGKYQKELEKYAGALRRQQVFESEQKSIENALAEISRNIGVYMQWSGIVEQAVRHMPDSLLLSMLSTDVKTANIKLPKPNEPGKFMTRSVPVRTMRIGLTASGTDNRDDAVYAYSEALRRDEMLAPLLEDVRFSREAKTKSNKEVLNYEIVCYFKPNF